MTRPRGEPSKLLPLKAARRWLRREQGDRLFDLFAAALGASVWLVTLLVAAHHLEDVLALPAFELIDWHVCVLVLGGLPFSIARLGEYDPAPETANNKRGRRRRAGDAKCQRGGLARTRRTG